MAQVYDFIQFRIRRLAGDFAADLDVELDPMELVMAVMNQTQGLTRSEFETLALASVAEDEGDFSEPVSINDFYLLLQAAGGKSATTLRDGESREVSGEELEKLLEGWSPIPMGWVYDAMETHSELFSLISEHGIDRAPTWVTTTEAEAHP